MKYHIIIIVAMSLGLPTMNQGCSKTYDSIDSLIEGYRENNPSNLRTQSQIWIEICNVDRAYRPNLQKLHNNNLDKFNTMLTTGIKPEEITPVILFCSNPLLFPEGLKYYLKQEFRRNHPSKKVPQDYFDKGIASEATPDQFFASLRKSVQETPKDYLYRLENPNSAINHPKSWRQSLQERVNQWSAAAKFSIIAAALTGLLAIGYNRETIINWLNNFFSKLGIGIQAQSTQINQ